MSWPQYFQQPVVRRVHWEEFQGHSNLGFLGEEATETETAKPPFEPTSDSEDPSADL